MPLQRRMGALAFALGTLIGGPAYGQELGQELSQELGQELGLETDQEAVPDTDAPVEPRNTPPNILVVDFDWVIRNSDAAQSVQTQLDAERQALQERFTGLEAELRAMEQGLEQMGDDVSSEEQLARRRDFEQLVADTQREAQARRSILDQAFREAMDIVRDASVRAIADIADRANAEIVLHINQTVIYSRDRNISQQALAALNEQLPEVEFQLQTQE